MKQFTHTIQPKELFAIALVTGVFVLVSLLSGTYVNEIERTVGIGGFWGALAYVGVTIVAVIVAPISTLPLLPIASSLWGWQLAGVFSIIGWTVGAQIAFFLARHYGQGVVQKLVSLERLRQIEARVPEQHLFWSVVLLRMTIPVDVLSYAIGLFTTMKSLPYFFSTLLGVTPFAFIFAFAGTLPFIYQVEILSAVILLVLVLYGGKNNKPNVTH